MNGAADRAEYRRSAGILARSHGGIRFLLFVVKSGGPAAEVCREVLRGAAEDRYEGGTGRWAREALAEADAVPERIEPCRGS